MVKMSDDSEFCGGRLWAWVVLVVATRLKGVVSWSGFGSCDGWLNNNGNGWIHGGAVTVALWWLGFSILGFSPFFFFDGFDRGGM